MFLYVTEKINNHHKIGISNDIHSRIQQYRTLIPDLNFDIVIQVPSISNLRLYENTIKRGLESFRIKRGFGDSECYEIQLKYIQDYILKSTLLLNFICLDFHLFLHNDYPKYGQYGNKARGVGYPFHKGVTIFLNEIYFGKKIPLFNLERLSKNRIRFNLIRKLKNYEELQEITNYYADFLKVKNIGLNNYLSKYLENFDKKIIKISNKPRAIIYHLMPILFEALTKKIYQLPVDFNWERTILLSDTKSKNFPVKCMAFGRRNSKEGRSFNNFTQKRIRFIHHAEINAYKKYSKKSTPGLINKIK